MGGASERPRGAELPAGVKPGHPRSILRDTLSSCGTSGCTLHGAKNWLDGRAQRAAANGATSGRRPVTSGVPGGSVLGPVLFNALIDGLDAGVECTASTFAAAAELGGAVGSLEGREALRRGLGRRGPWAIISGTELNKNKCRILHLGRRKAGHKSKLGEGRLESSPAERDLGVLVGSSSAAASSVPRQPRAELPCPTLLSLGRTAHGVQYPRGGLSRLGPLRPLAHPGCCPGLRGTPWCGAGTARQLSAAPPGPLCRKVPPSRPSRARHQLRPEIDRRFPDATVSSAASPKLSLALVRPRATLGLEK